MFRKKEDQTELELLRIRVRNLEKQVAELKKAPQVQAEEQKKAFDEWYAKAVKATVRELHRIAES